MKSDSASAPFVRELRRVLRKLYDPTELRNSPLLDLLVVDGREQPMASLQRVLTEAIEALKPDANVPPQANAWRIYHILSQRYVEQFLQRVVAENLALSSRQLGRIEKQALQALADYLWVHYDVGDEELSEGATPPQRGAMVPETRGRTPSQEEELAWLRNHCPIEAVNVTDLVQAALRIVAPLADALGVRVVPAAPANAPRVAVQPTAVRQALVNVLTSAIRTVPGGRLQTRIEVERWQVGVCVSSIMERSRGFFPPATEPAESLEMARHLVALAGGSLTVRQSESEREAFTARLILPVAQQIAVLVIDDNADTLQLLQRYLENSQYRFIGVRDPQQALAVAEEVVPQIIVLDVMLPGIDGWELLGNLRVHPKTREAPIIVCTILPEEQLAFALGAVAFISKPVSQEAFLATLNRQLVPRRRESQ